MKNLVLCLIMLLLPIPELIGQGFELDELVVESPRFRADNDMALIRKIQDSASIYDYFQAYIEYPQKALNENEQGIVVVKFAVETDGTLNNIRLQNPVSAELDQCVMECLLSTSGKWVPGRVNGSPVAMESKIYIGFIIPHTKTLAEYAKIHYLEGLKHFYASYSEPFTHPIISKRDTRQFKRSLEQFNEASKFAPEKLAIVLMQACIYEKLGDFDNYQQKQKEYQELSANIPSDEEIIAFIYP